MKVILYKVTKRPNSTLQPKTSEGREVNCQLKEETSFLYPSLILSKDIVLGVFSPDTYNYVYIPYWQRYYYITDWKYINCVWECSLTVDVLASFKKEIGLTSAYIVRASSAVNNYVVDNFYPATDRVEISNREISTYVYNKSVTNGCFVLGVINNQASNRIGAVTYYVVNITQFNSLLTYLFSSNIYQNSNITEVGEGLYKSLFDPFQYVVSCMWLPMPANTVGQTSTTIKVGYWDTNVTALLLKGVSLSTNVYSLAALPNHPQSNKGYYLNYAPFTRATAYLEPFGEIPIDTTFMQYANNWFLARIYTDCITGMAECYCSITDTATPSSDYNNIFTMRTAQVGVPIQLSQVTSDYIGMLTGGINTVTSGFSGNLGGVFTNIISAVQSAFPKVSSKGANGSFVETASPGVIVFEHYRIVDTDPDEFGRPVCAVKTIKNLSGFIQTGEDDHAFTCTSTESAMINRFMKEGFFYE